MLFAALAGASLGFPAVQPDAREAFPWRFGRLLLGFTIAGLSVDGSTRFDRTRAALHPAGGAGAAVLDTGVAFLRRFLDGKHPFKADYDHFHDRIERMLRLSPLQVTLATYGLTAVFCLAAVLAHSWYKNVGSAVVGAGVLIFAVFLILVLGYGTSMWNSTRVLSLRGHRPSAEERV